MAWDDPAVFETTVEQLLEREGMVQFRTGHDRRQRNVELSALGRQQLRKALTRWQRGLDEIRQALGPTQLQELMTILKGTDRALDE